MTNLVVLGQTVGALWKSLTFASAFHGHPRSLNPTRIIPWLTKKSLHDLLVSHGNYGPISYRFRNEGR